MTFFKDKCVEDRNVSTYVTNVTVKAHQMVHAVTNAALNFIKNGQKFIKQRSFDVLSKFIKQSFTFILQSKYCYKYMKLI